jgi:5'-deoxynucleotidase YfbR-like HD superfamily hydrolase
MRNGSEVKRYHTQRTLRQQTVGAHSFNMLLLLEQVSPGARREVYQHILHHDLPELFTGDIPGPAKKASVDLGLVLEGLEQDLAPLYQDCGLTVDEERLVKWLDKIELLFWCQEEVMMGNTFATEPIEVVLGWLEKTPPPNLECRQLYVELLESIDLNVSPVIERRPS